ncbi:DUF547 domain-containing protein [Xanthovirga aplysinae]|uniref:DUF547 domain-containing protein n=1 Tax=Xanthovirga aplysinae TaxID=2529853 RepID=UPI0012BD1A8A|nr:DUF547 domain-containing protein [Xanthovirga aplysinae]MTI33514.1 DUF547 domain-containing protein [Xanthovirga aplysinae]
MKAIKISILFIVVLVGGLWAFCPFNVNIPESSKNSIPPSHHLWTTLLQKHVSSQGWVDYEGFQADSTQLQTYLEELSQNIPQDSWTREEKLAYWINAYNAFTVELIIDHYPVESIEDIGSLVQIPFVNSVFDIRFIDLNGKKYSLNFIEHLILRRRFKEPRIHFAIVCASYSCPKLRNEAYTADKLEEQLDDQAVDFINDPNRNDIRNPDDVELSRIFYWFYSDFKKHHETLIDYINQYAETPINAKAKVSFKTYDWTLNSTKLNE